MPPREIKRAIAIASAAMEQPRADAAVAGCETVKRADHAVGCPVAVGNGGMDGCAAGRLLRDAIQPPGLGRLRQLKLIARVPLNVLPVIAYARGRELDGEDCHIRHLATLDAGVISRIVFREPAHLWETRLPRRFVRLAAEF